MKIIDKTPLQDEQGNIGIVARIQGTLKYGLNWYAELEAQKLVIAQLERALEKGFVLIRNFKLPNSEIIIPIVLIGTGGIYVIYVTNAKGFFEAKGDQWNTVNNGNSQPASINLIGRLEQLKRAFEKYLDINKLNKVITTTEPVLIASDPGAQIESLRPNVRVVRSDAIKQFATSLSQARPVMSATMVSDLADQIIDPSLRREASPAPAAAEAPVSRAQAIFNASDPSKPFDPNDLGFEFEEERTPAPQNKRETPARPASTSKPAPAKRKILGMNKTQIALLAGMLLVECCVVIGFGIIIYLNQ